MAVIGPSWMIEDWIKANPVQRNAIIDCRLDFLADVTQPSWTRAVFGSGFRNDHGTMITMMDLAQHLAKRAVKRVITFQRGELPNLAEALQIIKPLVVRIKVHADNIQELLLPA